MKDNRMLDSKVSENEDIIKENGWKRFANLFICLGIAGISYAAGFMFYPILEELLIPFVLFGTLFPLAGSYMFETKTDRMNEAKKRIRHLDKIEQEGIHKTKKLDEKRAVQISNLEDKQSRLVGRINGATAAVGVGSLAWLGDMVASIFVQPALWASIGGLLTIALGLNGTSKNLKKYLEYQTRIDNLKDDLLLGPLYGYTEKDKDNELIDVQKEQLTKSKAIVNPTYESAVEQYIDGLENQETITKPQQKIKK